MTTIAELIIQKNQLLKLLRTNITEEGYTEFINNWNQCDEDKEDAIIFQTFKRMGSPSIKYALSIGIYNAKEENQSYISNIQ